MKSEKYTDHTHSQILITNIKRWEKISNKFHFGNTEKNKKIYLLFEAFYNIDMFIITSFTCCLL